MSRTEDEAWSARTCAQSLARAARRWPNQQALLIEGESRTFAELWLDVRRVAEGLCRLGLKRGDHFAICMGNSRQWCTLFLAAGTIGAVTVPINTRFKSDEIAYCLRQADIRMLAIAERFLSIDFIAMLRAIVPAIDRALPDGSFPLLTTVIVDGDNLPAGCISMRSLVHSDQQVSLEDQTEAAQPDDTLLIQYTSGTTAYPKGAMLSHASMLRDAFEVGRRLDLRPGDRYFSGRPLFHAAGTTMSLLCSLEAGACYLTTQSFDTERVLDIMEREQCTHTSGNDTMFLMMMSHPTFSRRKFSLRAAWAAATPAVMRQIIDRMGIPGLCSAFGMSECAPNAAMASVNDDVETRINGFARPLPGVSIRIWSEDLGQDLPPGATGEILVKGWNVMKGYYKMPEHTAQTIDADGWLHSGDLGVCDRQGRLAFVGRLKDSFRVGGENVAPAEVEDVLHRHPSIRQAQVVGVPDSRMVEVPAAYLILQPGASLTESDVIAWCRERCANFKVPRYVRFIESFEPIGMTASAKIQKRKLREFVVRDLGLESVVLTGRDPCASKS